MLEREPNSDTWVTDIPAGRVAQFRKAVYDHNPEGLYGIGGDAGKLAIFGSSSRYEGRDVTGYRMGHLGSVPFPSVNRAPVDWENTEKINRVPLQEVDPRPLVATQGFVTHGGMHHYLTDTTGELYDQNYSVSNQFPAVFEDAETGDRRILTGHHRATAALLKGEPLMARLVRGRMLKRR